MLLTSRPAAANSDWHCARWSHWNHRKGEAGVDGGLLVEGTGGSAALASVQPGDVLLAVNGAPMRSVEQVREVACKGDKSVALLIQRDGNKLFVPVRIG